MQRQIQNELHQAQALNPLKDMTKAESIDYSSDVKKMLNKVENLEKLYEAGKMDFNLLRYIPGLANTAYQEQIYYLQTKQKFASETYAQKNNVECEIILPTNEYTNFNNMHLFPPKKIKSKADNNNDIAAGTMPVNNFFVHWIKEVDIQRYGDDVPVLPLKTIEVYRYFDDMLKHLPKDALETFEVMLLYSKKKVELTGDRDRRLNNSNTAADRTNTNLTERITKFQNIIKENAAYKVSLKFLVDIGLVNFPFKFNTKFIFTLKANMNWLFESNVKGGVPNTVDAEIILHSAPYIFY